jgi:hypothetical protein
LLLCRVDGTDDGPESQALAEHWVRTVNGWERTESWNFPVTQLPRLHPLVVAAAQGLISVWAMVAFQRQESSNDGEICRGSPDPSTFA